MKTKQEIAAGRFCNLLCCMRQMLPLLLLLLVSGTASVSAQSQLSAGKKVFAGSLLQWTKTVVHFSTDSFKAGHTSDFSDFEGEALSPEYAILKPAFSYSPDGNYYIDFYSQNIVLEKRGNKTYYGGGDPDQGILLYCKKTGKTLRIAYFGSSQWVQDAAWIDNNRFLLVGTSNYETDEYNTPIIFLGDIRTKKLTQYAPFSNSVRQPRSAARYKTAAFKKLRLLELP